MLAGGGVGLLVIKTNKLEIALMSYDKFGPVVLINSLFHDASDYSSIIYYLTFYFISQVENLKNSILL